MPKRDISDFNSIAEIEDYIDSEDDSLRDANEPEQVLNELRPKQVPTTTGPYRSGAHFVLRDGSKIAACYPCASENLTAAQVAAKVAAALNK